MSSDTPLFSDLGLPQSLVDTLADIGYESPSPIQAAAIPALLEGRDVLGQAQTGTGKTAAFALPSLAGIDPENKVPQVLVLTPTRELAIQVAEAYQTYARKMPGFHVLPVYGGQSYGLQLKPLKRGCHVVVGTPGRLMDHMRRGTLVLDNLRTLVLDEADEMLRMGFQEDVEWILDQVPEETQIALFSATLPNEIRQVAENCLKNPVRVKIESKTRTAPNIRQRCWHVSGLNKLDALTRLLETETTDGVIVFVRTRLATSELAEKLAARGFAAEAISGEMAQAHREKIVERLRGGSLDILIATDVVGRGLDVERISHVINYDIPYDTEAYIHRIGRTGRAGRSGEAILFVAPRERRMLRSIEKATKQPIEVLSLPSAADVNESRLSRFKQKIAEKVEEGDAEIETYERIVAELAGDSEASLMRIAASLAAMIQGGEPLLLKDKPVRERPYRDASEGAEGARDRAPRRVSHKALPGTEALPLKDAPEVEMQRYLIPLGHAHGLKPTQVVGAIANEADLDSQYIGHIDIHDQFTTVDLPAGMPAELLAVLKKARLCGKPSQIRPYQSEADLPPAGASSDDDGSRPPRRSPRTGGDDRKPGKKPFRGKSSGGYGKEGRSPKSGPKSGKPGKPRKSNASDGPSGSPKRSKPGKKRNA